MVTGFVAGLLVGGLAAVAGAPTGYIVVAALGLGIPLAIFGIIYDVLLDKGRMPFGRIAPAALYGILTFPIARLLQELLLTAIFGQGIGFLMIHSQIMEVSAWRAYRKQAKEEREKGPPQAAEKQA